MALGFIKKVFSFGKDKVEETEAPTEVAQAASVPSDEAIARPEPAELAQEATETETPAAAVELQPEATPPADETRPEPEAAPVAEPEAAIEESVEPGAAAPESPTEPAAAEPAEDRQAAPEPEPVESEAEPPEPEVEAREEAPAAPEKAEPELPSEPEPPVETPEPQPTAEPTRRVTVSQAVEEVPTVPEEPEPAAPAPRASWFERLRKGLSRSSEQLGQNISGIFTRRKLDEDTLEELEDVLIQSDLGIETAMRVTDTLSKGRYGRDVDVAEVRKIMATEIETVLEPVARPLELDLSYKPHVILVVGVNGTGKTTTIGKLAAKLARGGLKVTLAAGDTFRAAAIEQLHIWGERTGSTVVSTKLGADAAGLAFDAWEKAKANGSDVLIIDTAGRLQNKTELMEELAKIVRVLGKHDPDAPHTVLQTLDATTGQNALNQVEIFRNVAGVNGLVMTKLDGTARGGILVAISAKHKLPVYFIGVGEGVDDLEPFSAKDFASAIAGTAQ